MFNFCTYFDQHYLARGLALYRSLKEYCHPFKLWVLCMDDSAYQILMGLQLSEVHPISLEEFEHNDEPLKNTKTNRTKIEYYFTCTPSLPLYVLNNWVEVDLITYLDADLFFFSSPVPLFEELRDNSISIISHRFSPNLKNFERHGIYNVAWIAFRRDTNGLACLRWWRERCIEWCYDRLEDGKYADQKYLDDWPGRFQNVVVLQHKGANLALWNVANYRIGHQRGNVMVDAQPLIFYHFHGLKKTAPRLYDLGLDDYGVKPSWVLRRNIYAPYIRVLLNIHHQTLPSSKSQLVLGSVRRGKRPQTPVKPISRIKRVVRQHRKLRSDTRNVVTGKYILALNGHAI